MGGLHTLHALASGVHVLCCGAPAAIQLSGMGLAAVGGVAAVHIWMHELEWLIWAFSLLAFGLGLWLEFRMRRGAGKPSMLLLVSGLCLLINVGLLGAHRFSLL